MKTAVLINALPGHDKALRKWKNIEKEIKQMLPADTIYLPFDSKAGYTGLVDDLLKVSGVKFFVSAGGDGSLNHMINTLGRLTHYRFTGLCIGAIGLGSSNDFHKPAGHRVKGIPVKIDFQNKNPVDLGLVEYSDSGETKSRLFAINASLGFVAQGNLFFNKGDAVIRFFQKNATGLAILWAVIKTFLNYRNHNLQIKMNDNDKNIRLTNLSVAKNPNVAGTFCYDIATAHDSGELGLYLAQNLTRFQAARLLVNMTRNRFSEYKNCSVEFIRNLQVDATETIALETDGEVFEGRHFEFSVLHKAIYQAG